MTKKVMKVCVRPSDNQDWVVMSILVNPETRRLDLDTFQGVVNILIGLTGIGPTASQYREILEQALTTNEVEEG